jgi:hypothetical protein
MKTTETLQQRVIRIAGGVNFRPYRSQPMPVSYSTLVRYANGRSQPSIMQQAFINSVH